MVGVDMYAENCTLQVVNMATRVYSETDEELACKATQEASAFHELYRRYAAPVYRYHVAWNGNAPAAQSLTSQTFFEAYSRLAAYRLGGHFVKRIFGIAREIRKIHGGESGVSFTDTSPGDLEIESLARAINRLGDDMAEAFVLRFFAGFDASEIGLILVKSDAAVKMLVYRGLCALNVLLSSSLEVQNDGQRSLPG